MVVVDWNRMMKTHRTPSAVELINVAWREDKLSVESIGREHRSRDEIKFLLDSPPALVRLGTSHVVFSAILLTSTPYSVQEN